MKCPTTKEINTYVLASLYKTYGEVKPWIASAAF